MNIDVKCVCGRVFEVTPPIPEYVDDGVCVPFDLSVKGEHFDYSEVEAVWGGTFGRTDSDFTCECGKTIHVVVTLQLEEKPEPERAEAAKKLEEFWIEAQLSYIENPGGKQVHASQYVSGYGKRDTYLYQENGSFYFEQYEKNRRQETLWLASEELKEHVVKLLPVLFTAEEMKKLLSGEGSPPVSAPPKPMS